ncbi:mandelate racemase/muconate lactonizing enzyme family protein [Tatumella sp. UBA2305]|uniref:mandelate racemase/muconate lactonizing enzyme family protein n=1 Tax=Tatumella sp. UBA2305 TaxID=1947647 RepID=UPI0025F62538|nr:mandelate racemase/muconate lactonizing enzyme family protein [Tatumella sp. UBA2305]
MKIRLWRGELHYSGVTLYTASSGPVSGLDTLWLTLEDQGQCGLGEVRLNISYLHGYTPEQVITNLLPVLSDWQDLPVGQELLSAIHGPESPLLAPGRMLLDMAVHDFLARSQQQTLAEFLGGPAGNVEFSTNQTLFWGSEQQLLTQAHQYVSRGFTQLKLRVGISDFDTDLARLTLLRDTFGQQISLAVDVNGQWTLPQARQAFARLQPLQLSYIEQPLAASQDAELPALQEYGIPVMLDESLNSEAALQRLVAAEGRLWGHLKLVKLGGIAPLVSAARQLKAAGVPFMIGQMNEGHAATAAALQLCYLLQPAFAELYGADGLTDDPASGLTYQQGRIRASDIPGLGVRFDMTTATLLQEFSDAKTR